MTKYPCRIGGEIIDMSPKEIATQINMSKCYVNQKIKDAKLLGKVGTEIFAHVKRTAGIKNLVPDGVTREKNKRLKTEESFYQKHKGLFESTLYRAW